MAKTRAAQRYRDTKTGRFASKSTWERSKARGGTRYKRERQEPARGTTEYQINVKYKAAEGKGKAELQISAKGPAGKTRKQAIQAVETKRKTGSNPKGWEVRITEWRKAGKRFPVKDEGWQQLNFFAHEAKFK